MEDSATINTRVLGIEKEGTFFPEIQRLVQKRCPRCEFETVPDAEDAAKLILQTAYDLLVVDTRGESDHTLLDLASRQGLPVLAVFSRDTSPETLRYLCNPSVRVFISKDRYDEAAEAIERLVSEPCRSRWRERLRKGAPAHDRFESESKIPERFVPL